MFMFICINQKTTSLISLYKHYMFIIFFLNFTINIMFFFSKRGEKISNQGKDIARRKTASPLLQATLVILSQMPFVPSIVQGQMCVGGMFSTKIFPIQFF